MTKATFDKIAAGLEEAIAIARGEAEPAQLHRAKDLDPRAIRAATGLSQLDFAKRFGFTAEQIRSWEQGRSRPLGGVRAYLTMIESDPEAVARLLDYARSRAA